MAEQAFDTPKDWLDSILRDLFRAMHSLEQDNFDSRRYPEAQRDTFFFEAHAKYMGFVIENAEAFHRARSLFADGDSRDLFDRLILYRLLGHHHVRLPFNNPEMRRRRTVPDEWRIDETGDIAMQEPLSIWSVPYRGQDVWVKGRASNVAATFLSGQYYFDRGGVRIAPAPGDHVIDGGGCLGDTALAFAADVGPNGRVYTFDPMLKHCEIMREVFGMNPGLASRIEIFDAGLADADRPRDPAHAVEDAVNPGARLEEGLPTRTLDSLVRSNEIPRIDFVKMDIEGSELSALQGGENALRRWKPGLAISLYHRWDDFFAIPLWLSAMNFGYRFFLDHYSIHHEETVLYAIANGTRDAATH